MCPQSGKKERMNQIFEATKAAEETAAGAPAAAGAAQIATSGVAAQPAGVSGDQAVVVKGSAGANYAGRGNSSVRNSVRDDDYSDINMRRKRRSASSSIGL